MNTKKRYYVKYRKDWSGNQHVAIWDRHTKKFIPLYAPLRDFWEAKIISDKMNEDFTMYTFLVNEYCLKPVHS